MKHSTRDINNHLFFEMPVVKTQVGVLFGARSVSGTIAREAVKLFRDEAFSKIILAGGLKVRQLEVLAALALQYKHKTLTKIPPLRDFYADEKETLYMHRILTDAGIEDDKIICVDDKSRNSGENIENILLVLKDFNAAAFICHAPTQRRLLATARKHKELDGLTIATHPVYSFGITKDNWHLSKLERYVREEFEKTNLDNENNYIKQGHCAEIDLEAELGRVRELVF